MAAFDFGAPRIRRLGRQYDKVKVDPRVNNGTTAGGLAFALQSALKGYEQGQERRAIKDDEGYQEAAQSALVRGLKGEPAMDAPLPDGISGPVRTAIPGGIDYAAEELASLEGNPYAGRLATQLLMSQREQEAEARQREALWRREDDRYAQRQATEQERWHQRFEAENAARRSNFDYEQANAYRAPKARQTVKAADGYNYFVDNGERVVPGAQAPTPALSDNLTPGQEAVDKAFGKDFAEFGAGGGFADAQKNIEQLHGVQTRLEDIAAGRSNENLTGPILGGQYDPVLSVVNPEALAAREAVEEVVQRNLRLVLGAQFTEKEGQRLIARAYNPRLSEAENAQRVGRLAQAMDAALKAKQDAAAYFQQNGTLRGYTAPTSISVSELESAIEGGQPGQSVPGGTQQFPAPPDVDPNLWAAMTPQERALWTD